MPTIDLEIPSGGQEITAGLHATNYQDIETLLNGGLDSVNLASNAVTTAKIDDAAVTRAKLATLTVKEPFWVEGPISLSAAPAFPDAATTTIVLRTMIPDDYVSGDVTYRIMIRPGAGGTGNLRWRTTLVRARSGAAVNILINGVDSTSAIVANSQVLTGTILAANVQAGDTFRLDFARIGADGADTLADTLQFDGAWIEYTGRA